MNMDCMNVTLEVSKLSGWLNAVACRNIWCMLVMSVRLDVSKLSGWLNADAHCRESKGGHTVWEEVQGTGRREVAGDRGARGVQGRARL